MKHQTDPNVKCPFYRQETAVKICCEGMTKQSSTHVVFTSLEGKKEHKNKYCKTFEFVKCPFFGVSRQIFCEIRFLEDFPEELFVISFKLE
jgi:hypothetical protein